MYFTERNARIQVTVNGTALNGALFSTFSGGDASSAVELVHPGNMQPGVQVQGLVTPSDITLTCPLTDANITWQGQLINALSIGDGSSSVTVTPLDQDKNPVRGASLTYKGVLKTVTPSPNDSTSSTQGKLSIVIAPDEGVTTS